MMYKRKVSLLLLVGALGLVFLTTGLAYAACLDGMTSYWKLEEDAGSFADSFDGNDGARVGTVAQVDGRVGFGQDFNGTNSEINVAADGSFGWGKDESFSIEYWMKRPATPVAIEVLVGRKGTTANPNWWVGLTADGYANFELSDGDGIGQDITGSVDLGNDAWHHVVAVRDAAADVLRLYVDGAEAAAPRATVYTAGFDSLTAAINMGWLANSSGFRYDGTLDEVAIYNRALSLNEIQAHYNGGTGVDYCAGAGGGASSAPYPEETISYWDMEEDAGSFADSFDGNDGARVGTVAQVDGRVGFGQDFNGTNSEINVAADGSFGWGKDESFSIEYWMKRPATPVAVEVLVGRKGTTANPNWWVGLTADGYANFELSDGDGIGQDITGSVDLGNDAWHHVVAVRDAAADVLRLYVDGAEAAAPRATVYTAGFDSLTAAINMGWLANSSGFRYDGTLDEVAIYDRVLTSDEIENHYQSGLQGRGIDDLLPTDDDDDDDGDGGGGGGGGGGCFIATVAK